MAMNAPPTLDGVELQPIQEVAVVLDPNTGRIGLRSNVPDPFKAIGLLEQGQYLLLKQVNNDHQRGRHAEPLLVAAGSLPPARGR